MNKVFISNYSNTKHFVNDEKVFDNEQAFTYDGKHAEMFLNRNGTIVYERLDNHDLHKLLDIDYAHKNSLVDKLEMLLPNTFPSPTLEWSTSTAVVVTRSSGKEVPSDTTVRPTTRGEILSLYAREEAPATNRSAPIASPAKPSTSVPMKSTII